MSAQSLINMLLSQDVKLWADDDNLEWDAPAGIITDDVKMQMATHKAEIIALLKGNCADTYNNDSETASDETPLIALLTQESSKPQLLLPEHLSDGWPYRNKIILGDCIEKLMLIGDDSIDQIVTDPPYGIEFMGKDWDKAVPGVEVWRECHRVLKPGAFAFVMCIPRQDCLARMILNLEAAGFKIDFTSLYWTFANGFPKARNINRAIDKSLGAEVKIKGRNPNSRENCDKSNTIYESGTVGKTAYVTEPSTPKAQEFDGGYAGFQPKPAVEIIIVAMKPLSEKTYTDQALANGKGATWLDDCRIPYAQNPDRAQVVSKFSGNGKYETGLTWSGKKKIENNFNHDGRFPANLLVSGDVLNDGKERFGGYFPGKRGKTEYFGLDQKESETVGEINDGGTYSRYFSLGAWWSKLSERFPENIRKNLPFLIVPKASRTEKESGLESFVEQPIKGRDPGQDERNVAFKSRPTYRRNTHPTVKAIQLMAYLVTMGSRHDDTVLDPFCGTATTCIAAKLLNRRYIGIEINPEYHGIAVSRIEGIDQIKSGKVLSLTDCLLEKDAGGTQNISIEYGYQPPAKKDNSDFINKIIQDDSFDLITKLEDNSIDLVLTSPPYADVTSYGKKVDIYDSENYVIWLLPLFNEIHRILKPTGSFILNINDRIVKKQRHTYVFELVCRAVKESNLKLYDRYFWVKKNAQPNCNSKRLSNSTEYLFHFCKNVDLIKWNMDAVREPYNATTLARGKYPVASTQFKVDESGIPQPRSIREFRVHEKGKIPSNVFNFPTAASIRGKKHPAVFHIDLPSWFIKALTDDGDLVLDPMCGTATTCVAAKQLNRNYIGIEINPAYHKMATERISSVNLVEKKQNDEPLHTAQVEMENDMTQIVSKIVKRGKGDFPKIYRPSRISEVYGQDEIKKIIQEGFDKGSLAHSYLFYGPSGTGKTTLARIIGMGLLCENGPTSEPCCECGSCIRVAKGCHLDFLDINCADSTGIDHIRKLHLQFDTVAFGKAKYKIFVFEECHQLSKESQNMLLKLVEDSHDQNYFVFCSTEPKNIIKTLRNRCLPIEFEKIPPEEISGLIKNVCECEGLNCPEEIMESIIQESEGMARNALFLLQKAVASGRLEKSVSGKDSGTTNDLKSPGCEDTGTISIAQDIPQQEQPKVDKKPKPFGTKEWAKINVNCCIGCSHNCRYCYARGYGLWYKRLAENDIDQWKVEKIRQKNVDKGYRKRDSLIMFPSSHDITPTNFTACHTVLGKLLKAGNKVLIVSKPHFECIDKICRDFTEYKDNILFRFTISATDNDILSFWEPGAPSYEERKQCLKIAWHFGFQTSVSVEPMLDPGRIDDLIAELDPLVTDTIWVGLMQHFQFVRIEDKTVESAIEKIRAGQTVDKIQPIYEKHKDNPKIRWKESIRKLLGLPGSAGPEMDNTKK